MDDTWIDQVVAACGKRYARQGNELRYRSGKEAFRSSRMTFVDAEAGRGLELMVDVRIPGEASAEEAATLVEALESQSLIPRGFARASDNTSPMTSQKGEVSGSARTLVYRSPAGEAEATAKHIRAIVESIDIPIVVGIHTEPDVVAKDPIPDGPRPKRASFEPMALWIFRLKSGLMHSITATVDPNTRTMTIMDRKMMWSTATCSDLKLAHIESFTARTQDSKTQIVGNKRDGSEVILLSSSEDQSMLSTFDRLAKKVMIPFTLGA